MMTESITGRLVSTQVRADMESEIPAEMNGLPDIMAHLLLQIQVRKEKVIKKKKKRKLTKSFHPIRIKRSETFENTQTIINQGHDKYFKAQDS